MKNLSKFLIAAVVIVCCTETACNKQEDSFMPASGDNNFMSQRSSKSGTVFTVSPGGDMQDSKAIQKAFDDAVAAGPGSTVQLTKGTFVLDERIEVEGFVGCFKGAGKDKTIITTPFDKPVDFSLPVADWESLIKFRHGNINVSDFTIKISNPHPCTGIIDNWTDGFPSILLFTGNSVKDPSTTEQSIDLTLNNVKFMGLHYIDESGTEIFNTLYPFQIGWDGYDPVEYYSLICSFKITNCEFKSCWNGVFVTCDGTSKIGGNISRNNFEDGANGIMIYDCSNLLLDISNNFFTEMSEGNGVQLVQGWYVDPSIISKFMIRNNYIELTGNGDGIQLVDYGINHGKGKKINANVSYNQINLLNTIDWGGGIAGSYAKDVMVTDNKLCGNTIAGIYSSTPEGEPTDEMSGWIIKGNNVQELETQVAPIWLNSSSHDNTVIGSSLNTTVLDEGTNNVLINVNKKHWDHSPQEIHDKMMRHNEMMKSFRGHRIR